MRTLEEEMAPKRGQELSSSPPAPAASRKGLVIVHTGTGKGKTTAALGLMLRAWGHGQKVLLLQFMKRPSNNTGEYRAAQRLGVEVIARGDGLGWRSRDPEKSRALAQELWALAREKINSGEHQMVILDELSYPIQYGWLPVEEALEVLRQRPEGVHVVITGRQVPQPLIDLADLVTEMREVKHPLRHGVKAQPGIEF